MLRYNYFFISVYLQQRKIKGFKKSAGKNSGQDTEIIVKTNQQ